jgi:hypothetical protein
MSLGFWLNYQNTLGLLAKLPKYPFEIGMGLFWLFGFWAFSILGFFGLF